MRAGRAAVAAVLGAVLGRLPMAGAEALPGSPPVVDLHVDLSYRVSYGHGTLAGGSGQFVGSALRRAGVVGVVLPLFVPKTVSPTGPRAEDLEASFARLVGLLPETPPYSLPGCRAPDGAVRTWLSFEGAAPLSGDPSAVERWMARGVRIFGLVHTVSNALATSSSDAGGSSVGLTPAGRELVHRIHRAGGVVDVSHASDAAADEVIALALADGAPAVATHSNARALTANPRNLTDDQIRGIARTGGVVGVNFHSRFLTDRGQASLSDVVRHLKHLLRVGGIDHVAIGSDFEGDILPPRGLGNVSGLPRLAAALERAGVAHDSVAKVFGSNALRVLCPDAPALKK